MLFGTPGPQTAVKSGLLLEIDGLKKIGKTECYECHAQPWGFRHNPEGSGSYRCNWWVAALWQRPGCHYDHDAMATGQLRWKTGSTIPFWAFWSIQPPVVLELNGLTQTLVPWWLRCRNSFPDPLSSCSQWRKWRAWSFLCETFYGMGPVMHDKDLTYAMVKSWII